MLSARLESRVQRLELTPDSRRETDSSIYVIGWCVFSGRDMEKRNIESRRNV